MTARCAALVLVALLGFAGCAPRALVRPPAGKPVAAAPLARSLAKYNRQAESVRVQGRLAVRGQGKAEFGARVARGEGIRLDAVAGPFGTPVLAVACRWEEDCLVYAPPRKRAYLWTNSAWRGWFDVMLRGRVPEIGPALEAWLLPDGRRVLALDGPRGWVEEIEFHPTADVPIRVVLTGAGEPQAEMEYADPWESAVGTFPRRITVRLQEPSREYEMEFRRVEPGGPAAESWPSLNVPPDTAFERMTGATHWNQVGIPYWPPVQQP